MEGGGTLLALPPFFYMYELMRYIIDDVLMSPTLAPFTVSILVVFMGVGVLGAFTGGGDHGTLDEDE